MKILHIACIQNSSLTGVSVVVPQHIISQRQFADVAFMNVNNEDIINLQDMQKPVPIPFEIKKVDVDLVVFHEVYRPQHLKIARYLKKNHIPYIIIPHGCLTSESQKKKHWKKVIGNILLFNKFINGAVALQMLSEREKDNTKFGKNKFIGTNGIFLPTVYKKSFHDNRTDFIYIGRLDVFHKGIDLMIKAISLIKNELNNEEVHFSLYGPFMNGRDKEIRDLIKEYSVEEYFSLNREVTGKEKIELLLKADIFIQTSRFEGMPMGILEAMSYGVPVLITEGTTLGESVLENKAGWVAETNSESIAHQLSLTINQHAELFQRGKNARASMKKHFNWDTISKNTVLHYQELIVKKYE